MTRPLALVVTVGLLARPVAFVRPPLPDPFAFFRPTIEISAEDRRRLDRGEPLVRILPGADSELAVFGGIAIHVDGARLIAWEREIAALKQNAMVLSIGRFSNPPRLDDLRKLVLDNDELKDVGHCRPGDCALKLASDDIGRLKQAIAGAPPGAQETFRHIVLERVQRYLAGGHSALPASVDRDRPTAPVFAAFFQRSPFLVEHLPAFVTYLRSYPDAPDPDVESFAYWSKEKFGGRPVISATQVSMLRGRDDGAPDALVVGLQIFTTHYTNGSFSVTAVVRGGPGSPNYLRIKGLMKAAGLNTVCEEARCPNIGECWHHGTATFMILGDVCTRACGYCAVPHGMPSPIDAAEPRRLAETVAAMQLQYVVITSVDRDDVSDGGASHFAAVITAIRSSTPGCRIEVLIPDFQGSEASLRTVLDAGPDVLNHNTETVPRLYRLARPGGRYPGNHWRRAFGCAPQPAWEVLRAARLRHF